MTLRRVEVGDSFPTDKTTVNAWTEAAIAHQQGQGRTAEGAWTSLDSAGILLLRNKSGVDRQQYDVLGIDEPIVTPTANLTQFKNQVAFDGVTPTASHYGRFAVLLEPVKQDRIVPARVAGFTVAKVDFSDGVFRYADVAVGNAGALDASPIGSARIFWPTTGTGVEWSGVLLGVGNSHELVGVRLAA